MKHDLEFIAEVTGTVYNLAADAIEKYGHTKNAMVDHRGRMCLYGALNFVMHGDALAYDAGDVAHIKLLELRRIGGVGGNPISWNNMPERTQAEVVAVLRKAAKVL